MGGAPEAVVCEPEGRKRDRFQLRGWRGDLTATWPTQTQPSFTQQKPRRKSPVLEYKWHSSVEYILEGLRISSVYEARPRWNDQNPVKSQPRVCQGFWAGRFFYQGRLPLRHRDDDLSGPERRMTYTGPYNNIECVI